MSKTMKEIDFIPDWYCASCRRKRDLMVRGTLLGIFALALLIVSAGRYAQAAVARENVARLQTSFDSQAQMIQTLTELELRLDELRAKRQLLADVAGGAPVHGMVAELSHLMPQAMALTQLHIARERRVPDSGPRESKASEDAKVAHEDGDGELMVMGWAASDVNVGSLMTNIARSPVFGDPELRYSKPMVVNGRAAREFRLTSPLPQFE